MQTLSGYEAVQVRRVQDVLFVTLNQPATRNALSMEMQDEFQRVMDIVHEDATVRALVMRGAGGFFCAGGNIGGFRESLAAQEADEDPIALRNRRFGHFMDRLSALPVPVLAVVEGAAMGGGMGLAMAADYVLATEKARFALSETTLGVIAAQIAPFVVERLGARCTRRLGLSGERVQGDLALRLGVIDDHAPDGDALDALEAEWLSRIGRCAPRANRRFKQLVNRCGHEPNAALLDDAALHFSRCLRDEGSEGTQAFRDKRDAQWCISFDTESIRAAHGVTPIPSQKPSQGALA